MSVGRAMTRGGWSALMFVWAASAAAQAAQSGVAMAPNNDLPNPYRTVEGWAQLGRPWGSTSAVEIDRDGHSVWVAERCGANNCAESSFPAVFKFDSEGKLVTSFGAGMFIAPHGIYVDRDDNVWIADCACTSGRGRSASDSAPPTSEDGVGCVGARGRDVLRLLADFERWTSPVFSMGSKAVGGASRRGVRSCSCTSQRLTPLRERLTPLRVGRRAARPVRRPRELRSRPGGRVRGERRRGWAS